jgi:hypothetical protein
MTISINQRRYNLNISPSPDPTLYQEFTDHTSQATVAVHLGKKIGDTIETHWPIDPVSIAPNYDTTLIHLKRRNALIPVTSVQTAPVQADIDAYGVELLSQQYSGPMVAGMSSRMTDDPVPVYMDLIRGTVFSSAAPLSIPIAGTIARPWSDASPLLRAWWRKLRKFKKTMMGQSRGKWFPGTLATTDLLWTDFISREELFSNKEAALAALFPDDCIYELVTNGSAAPRVRGGIFVEFRWYDNNLDSPTVGFASIEKYIIYPPWGEEGGWADEVVEIYAYSSWALSTLVHFVCSIGGLNEVWSRGQTTETVVVDGVTGHFYHTVWSLNTYGLPAPAVMDYIAANHRVPQVPEYTLGGDWTAGSNMIKDQYLRNVLYYTPELARKIEIYLQAKGGVVDKGVGHELEYLILLLEQLRHGATTPYKCTTALPWEDGLALAARPRCVDGFCILLGYTSSIADPGGSPLNIIDIAQNALVDDKDGRSIPVLFTSRDDFSDESKKPNKPIISYSTKTGAQIFDVMTKYQQRPDFPAEFTQAMIDDMATQGMAALLIPAQPKTAMTFNQSAMFGSIFEDTTLTGDTLYVSRDQLGEPVTFNEGLEILETNGFFADSINQMILLPYQMTAAEPTPIVVTVDPVLDPTWDSAAVPLEELKLKLLSTPELIIIEGTADMYTNYNSVAQTLSYATITENILRAFLGIDQRTSDAANANDIDLTPLNPGIYTAMAPLKYVDLSGSFLQYRLAAGGSYVDMAIIQKDIPKVARYVYNAVLMPLISKIDPL